MGSQLILTEAERLRLINMLVISIDHRQEFLDGPEPDALGINAIPIKATLKLDRSILIKLSGMEVDDGWLTGNTWQAVLDTAKEMLDDNR